MQALITGGEGFIGGYIKKCLEEIGVPPETYDLKSGKDILDLEKFAHTITEAGIDSIFHCAAKISVPESFVKKDEYDLINIQGTKNVFKAAEQGAEQDKRPIKIVFSSSAAVYGEYGTMVKENFALNPQSPYADQKIAGEQTLASGVAEKKHIVLRYFNVYGPGQSPEYAGVVTHFIRAALKGEDIVIFGDGNAVRDFVFVEDIAKANVCAMKYNNKVFEIFNIGSGVETKVKDLAELIIKLTNSPSKIVYKEARMGDIVYSCSDVSKAKNILGWEAEVSLEDGLRKTIGYFRSK